MKRVNYVSKWISRKFKRNYELRSDVLICSIIDDEKLNKVLVSVDGKDE